jgi:hypothetical protein
MSERDIWLRRSISKFSIYTNYLFAWKNVYFHILFEIWPTLPPTSTSALRQKRHFIFTGVFSAENLNDQSPASGIFLQQKACLQSQNPTNTALCTYVFLFLGDINSWERMPHHPWGLLSIKGITSIYRFILILGKKQNECSGLLWWTESSRCPFRICFGERIMALDVTNTESNGWWILRGNSRLPGQIERYLESNIWQYLYAPVVLIKCW